MCNCPEPPIVGFGKNGSGCWDVRNSSSISHCNFEGFPTRKTWGALGIIAGSIGVGTAAGPIFGGVVGQYLGWNALFWFTFLLAIMIVIGAYYALPTIKPAESVGSNKNFDFIGGLFLGLTVGLLLLASLKEKLLVFLRSHR